MTPIGLCLPLLSPLFFGFVTCQIPVKLTPAPGIGRVTPWADVADGVTTRRMPRHRVLGGLGGLASFHGDGLLMESRGSGDSGEEGEEDKSAVRFFGRISVALGESAPQDVAEQFRQEYDELNAGENGTLAETLDGLVDEMSERHFRYLRDVLDLLHSPVAVNGDDVIDGDGVSD